MEKRPPVSCFCLTYGRPAVLEEAIQSFLLQVAAAVEEQARRGEIPLGRVVLQPGWRHDYPQLAADQLAAGAAPKEG